MTRIPTCVFAALLLAACNSQAVSGPALPPASAAAAPAGDPRALASEGLAIARARCSSCHAVAAREISPNPDSPPFEAIANTPGLSAETLHAWLDNAHDFPAEMYFAIAPGDVDDLVAYVVTLKRADYTPPIE